jgi:carboxymethylenebutenolidase
MKKLIVLMLGIASFAGASTYGQTTAPGQSARPENWQEQQKSQAWATAKIRNSPRHHEWVQISLGGRTLKAFVTYPQGKRHAPAVLVLHEVFGLTDSTLATADAISAMGYVTVTPDMLSSFAPDGGGTSAFPTVHMTGDFMTVLPDDTVNATLNAWADYATRLPDTDGKLAVVGLSWGGGAAFRYAASADHRRNLQAVFVFYDVGPPAVTQGPDKFGKNKSPISVDRIDVPVHGFYPDQDARVMASLPATKDAMAAAGKTFDAVVYKGAEHAYMRVGEDPADRNPANAAAVKASMARLQALLGTL